MWCRPYNPPSCYNPPSSYNPPPCPNPPSSKPPASSNPPAANCSTQSSNPPPTYGGSGNFNFGGNNTGNNYGNIGGNNNNGSVNVYHLRGEDDSSFSFVTVKNDLDVSVHLEIRTPGGLYYLGDRHIPAGEDDDSKLLKGTYDIHVISSDGKIVLSSVTVTDDVEISASDVLKGAATVATDSKIVLKTGDGISVFLSEEGLVGYTKVFLGGKEDKIEAALDRLRAPPTAVEAEGEADKTE